jgi:hypothetical protein
MAQPRTTDAMDSYADESHSATPRWFSKALERFVAAGTITRDQADAACPRPPAA